MLRWLAVSSIRGEVLPDLIWFRIVVKCFFDFFSYSLSGSLTISSLSQNHHKAYDSCKFLSDRVYDTVGYRCRKEWVHARSNRKLFSIAKARDPVISANLSHCWHFGSNRDSKLASSWSTNFYPHQSPVTTFREQVKKLVWNQIIAYRESLCILRLFELLSRNCSERFAPQLKFI